MAGQPFGIKVGYPRIRKRIGEKLTAYIQLVRPLTMMAPLMGGLAGGLMGYKFAFGFVPSLLVGLHTVWFPIVYGVVNLLLVQMGNNALNQAAEVELDAVSKPFRPIPRGAIDKDEAMGLAMVLYSLALFRSVMVNEVYSIIMLVIVFSTIGYSLKPTYFKSRLWLGYLDLGFARGGLLFLVSFSIHGNPFMPLPLSIALILAVFVFGANATKDFVDREADASFGIRTLATVYGDQARKIIAPFFLTPSLLTGLFVYAGVLSFSFLWIVLLVPVAAYAVVVLVVMPERQLGLTENTLSWVLFYVYFSMLFMGYALIYLLI